MSRRELGVITLPVREAPNLQAPNIFTSTNAFVGILLHPIVKLEDLLAGFGNFSACFLDTPGTNSRYGDLVLFAVAS